MRNEAAAAGGCFGNARRTFSITASTVMPSMQYGSRQRIFGYGVVQGYRKQGPQFFGDWTTRSRWPNGLTRSGSAGPKSVTVRVPTAAARCARPESEPTYSVA